MLAEERVELGAELRAQRQEVLAPGLVGLEAGERVLHAGRAHRRGDLLHARALLLEHGLRPVHELRGREVAAGRQRELLAVEFLAEAPVAAALVRGLLEILLEADERRRGFVDGLARALGQRRRLRVDLAEERVLEELRQAVDLQQADHHVRLRHADQVVLGLVEVRRELLDAPDRVLEAGRRRGELALQQSGDAFAGLADVEVGVVLPRALVLEFEQGGLRAVQEDAQVEAIVRVEAFLGDALEALLQGHESSRPRDHGSSCRGPGAGDRGRDGRAPLP